jgi:hypothetical protein
MTGYQSKKAAALDEEGMYLVHHTQPAQEPVAWTDEQLQMLNFLYGCGEWDGLWFDQTHPTKQGAFWWRSDFRRLFETPPAAQPAQEPVAWMYQSNNEFGWRDEIQFVQPPNHPVFRNVVALYTAPPQRPWVGLTDEQIADYLGDEYHDMTESELRFFRLGEVAAKEKNNGT